MRRATTLCLLLAACGAPAADRADVAAPRPDSGGWSYDVVVADDLSRLDVRVAFAGAPPPRLVLGDARGLAALSPPTATSHAATHPLPRDGDAFATDGVGDDATIAYRVDLDALAADAVATRVGRCVSANPGSWLLRPRFAPDAAHATLSVHLPAGMTISAPWPRRTDGAYALDETAFRWTSFAAFGRLETHEIDVDGARLSVAVLDRPHAATWPEIEQWLATAARAETSLYGAFPVPRAQIVVKPVSSNRGVAFGETLRGGGHATILYLGDEAKADALADDWVAVHEFAHLGMPAIPDTDAWLSEGFVTYYQVVLMGRAGILDERAAWREMTAGFARGRRDGTGRTIADESATMGRAHTYQRVYWAGAAIALLLDLELRRTSGGAKSLDDAIREVHREFAARPRQATGAAILAHLDAWLGRPLFSGVANPLLASSEFPSVDAALARLGVVVRGSHVESLDDAAPEAAIRRAIVPPAGR